MEFLNSLTLKLIPTSILLEESCGHGRQKFTNSLLQDNSTSRLKEVVKWTPLHDRNHP